MIIETKYLNNNSKKNKLNTSSIKNNKYLSTDSINNRKYVNKNDSNKRKDLNDNIEPVSIINNKNGDRTNQTYVFSSTFSV